MTRPSHLTTQQAARFVGVSHAAVQDRVRRDRLPWIVEQGTKMFAVTDLRAWKREIAKREQAADATVDA